MASKGQRPGAGGSGRANGKNTSGNRASGGHQMSGGQAPRTNARPTGGNTKGTPAPRNARPPEKPGNTGRPAPKPPVPRRPGRPAPPRRIPRAIPFGITMGTLLYLNDYNETYQTYEALSRITAGIGTDRDYRLCDRYFGRRIHDDEYYGLYSWMADYLGMW